MKNHLIFSNGIRKDFVALAADFCKELPFDIRNPMRYFLPIFVKYVGVRVREEKLDYVEHNKITRRDLDSIEGKLEMEIETPSGDRPSRPEITSNGFTDWTYDFGTACFQTRGRKEFGEWWCSIIPNSPRKDFYDINCHKEGERCHIVCCWPGSSKEAEQAFKKYEKGKKEGKILSLEKESP